MWTSSQSSGGCRLGFLYSSGRLRGLPVWTRLVGRASWTNTRSLQPLEEFGTVKAATFCRLLMYGGTCPEYESCLSDLKVHCMFTAAEGSEGLQIITESLPHLRPPCNAPIPCLSCTSAKKPSSPSPFWSINRWWDESGVR